MGRKAPSSVSTAASVRSTAATFCSEIAAPLGAGDRHDVVAARERPGEATWCHGARPSSAQLRASGAKQTQVLVSKLPSWKRGMGVAAVGANEVVALGESCR